MLLVLMYNSYVIWNKIKWFIHQLLYSYIKLIYLEIKYVTFIIFENYIQSLL